MVCSCGQSFNIDDNSVLVIGNIDLSRKQSYIEPYSGEQYWSFRDKFSVAVKCPHCKARFSLVQDDERMVIKRR